jgi:hypothetical protein
MNLDQPDQGSPASNAADADAEAAVLADRGRLRR